MKPPNSPPRGRDGFTLIEVLIAMVILSVGLLALEGVAVSAAKMTASAARRSRYTEVATDTLERTLSRLREGQGVSANATSFNLADNGGNTVATVNVNVTDGGSLTSPVIKRWDVTVRVIPTQTTRLADSVNLTASVIQ